MPRKRPGPPGKPPVYWWSEEIAALRRYCLALRRQYQRRLRHANPPDLLEARTAFALARRAPRMAIRDSKKKCWSNLCAQVDTDPLARSFKIVMKKLGFRLPGGDSRGREASIANVLFPATPVTDWATAPSAAVYNIFEPFDPILNELVFTRVVLEFTIDELGKAAKRHLVGKAPGPSGIPNEVLRSVLNT